MLVLSRKLYESIMIGDYIRITVVETGPHSVRLGIEAPLDTRVNRREAWERKREETQAE